MKKVLNQLVILSSIIILIITTSLSKSEDIENYKILFTGKYLNSITNAESGEKWLGLFPEEDNYILKQIEIIIDNHIDSISNKRYTIKLQKISTEDSTKPILLISGENNLSPGIVKGAAFEHQRRLAPAEITYIQLNATQRGWLAVFGNAVDKENRFPGDILIEDYEIKYFDRLTNKSQSLVKYNRVTLESLPHLVWAGDLDGDNKLDLLMDLSRNYGALYTLFLSSLAIDGDFFGKAAEIQIPGC